MPQPDDLFEASKMSFGDHLEELRSALFKSIIAITVGFLIGLFFAGKFVKFVVGPLEASVENHLKTQAMDKYIAELRDRQAKGEEIPVDLDSDKSVEAFRELFYQRGLVPKTVLIFPEQIENQAAVVDDPDVLRTMTIFERAKDDPRRVIATGVTKGFMVWLKAGLVLGLVLASPFVFFFVWNFVAAGLYPHEKHYVYIYMPFSIVLFLLGAALAFFFVIHLVLDFLFWFNRILGIAPYPAIDDWLGFILVLPLGFGISFQLPLVMLFLERIGIFSEEIYLKHWRGAVVVIFFLSMICTPSDPYSILFLAIPLTVLYFGGVLLCHFMPRRASPFGELIET